MSTASSRESRWTSRPPADVAFPTNVSKMSVTLPDSASARPRTLASGVVAQAQDAYRQRMALVGEATQRFSGEHRRDRVALGRSLGAVVEVLEAELGHDRELLDRVLLALASASTNRGLSAAAS